MNIQLSKVVSQVNDRFYCCENTLRQLDNWTSGLCCKLSRCELYIDFNQLLQLYRKLSRQTFRQVTGQKDTIHNIFLSNYPVEIVSTFNADSAYWRFYNKKRLIKNTLFISRVNSNVLAKQIRSLANSRLER